MRRPSMNRRTTPATSRNVFSETKKKMLSRNVAMAPP